MDSMDSPFCEPFFSKTEGAHTNSEVRSGNIVSLRQFDPKPGDQSHPFKNMQIVYICRFTFVKAFSPTACNAWRVHSPARTAPNPTIAV